MRHLFAIGLLLFSGLTFGQTSPLQVITYHDVTEDDSPGPARDAMAVSTSNLIAHFRWLRDQGYQPVSIEQIEAANNGGDALPEKPVLLSFDDGLLSVYTHVYPLLKLFHYPAVVSLVTGWIEGDQNVRYAGRERGYDSFLSWVQIREMQASGLVEIASHSHALHQGITANPQGNTEPAATSLLYLEGAYETADDFRARIFRDLRSSVDIISANTGVVPRVITWPYGAYNDVTIEIARQVGLYWSLTLDPNFGNPEGTRLLHRHLIENNPGIREFSIALLKPPEPPLLRAAQVDLDYVYDKDPEQQERNLDKLVERISRLQISHVFLQAFSDLDGDGGAEALYFPNRFLPMRADLFNRVAWQLRTRAGVGVYAWMPILSFSGAAVDPSWRVLQASAEGVGPDPQGEPRLSPFNPDARALIRGIYEDLASHSHIEGLHFHDDGRLNEREDASSVAIQAYQDMYGENIDLLGLKDNPVTGQRWANMKTLALINFTDELATLVRRYQPRLKTSRNLFAPALSEQDGARLLAQDYGRFLTTYDFVTVMAMPYLENVEDPSNNLDFYRGLVDQAHRLDPSLARTIFQLQTVDWRQKNRIPSTELKQTLRLLQSIGVRNLAYYPDDFLNNHPDLDELRQGISLSEQPIRSQP
ncbi:MAG: poly-beta-1,6-N-acetyl-D-glucosamine N-deacetylase PgaB [Gammaproteobacteria bacterium]|nr:poly-beta-1,6-N-acetyl-D-glucosamine N-deacetylase PgaB [Gammaproteobacteria bacterium]